MSTDINGGNFGQNVGFGALSGAGAATVVYGVGFAYERYVFGTDVTNTPTVQEALQKYQSRFSNENVSNIRVFEGGAGLPQGHYGITTWDGNKIALAEGLLENREFAMQIMGHELQHAGLIRAWPNVRTVYESFKAWFGNFGNPLEWIAEHRGSVSATEVMGHPVPMDPFYTHP